METARATLGEWGLFLILLTVGSLAIIATTVAPHRRKTQEFRARAAQLEAEVEQLDAENARLEAEIAAIGTDPFIVERELRRRTGFLRPGEHRFAAVTPPAAPAGETGDGTDTAGDGE